MFPTPFPANMYQTADPFASGYPYPMQATYGSPVSTMSAFPYGFYGDASLGKSDNETSPSTSNEMDEAKKKQLSPEEYKKWRSKREKNNEAAKQSRRKRSDREKIQQEEIKGLKDELHNVTQKFTLERAQLQQQLQCQQRMIEDLQMQLQSYQQPSGADILTDKTNSVENKTYGYNVYQPYQI